MRAPPSVPVGFRDRPWTQELPAGKVGLRELYWFHHPTDPEFLVEPVECHFTSFGMTVLGMPNTQHDAASGYVVPQFLWLQGWWSPMLQRYQ